MPAFTLSVLPPINGIRSQGNSEIEARNFDTDIYQSGNIDFILLTHAHIDHSGLLPRIVHEGSKAPFTARLRQRPLPG